MYKDIFESIRNEAEKRNLRERTIQLYCSDVSYFLRWIGKNVSDLTLEDAESFLTAKRLEGRSPETHNHYRSAIKFLYKKVLKTVWDDDTVPAMKRERNLPGIQISRRLEMLCCSTWKKSATIRRAERSAVSPLVIGAATIPRIARTPPKVPNQSFEIFVATVAPEYAIPVA